MDNYDKNMIDAPVNLRRKGIPYTCYLNVIIRQD